MLTSFTYKNIKSVKIIIYIQVPHVRTLRNPLFSAVRAAAVLG